MTFFSRAAIATALSLVMTFLLLLIFQLDAPPPTREMLETSAGGSPTQSESAIRPVSLR